MGVEPMNSCVTFDLGETRFKGCGSINDIRKGERATVQQVTKEGGAIAGGVVSRNRSSRCGKHGSGHRPRIQIKRAAAKRGPLYLYRKPSTAATGTATATACGAAIVAFTGGQRRLQQES